MTFKTNVVLSYANNAWKFQPLTQLTAANADTVQPASFGATRADTPAAVGGNLKLASFNVLNYFPTTGDQIAGCTFYPDRDGNPITVKGGCDVRGAANAENFKRQQDKIVAAISKSGADVVTLMEVENSAQFGKNRDDALAKLVDALNIATPGDLGLRPHARQRTPAGRRGHDPHRVHLQEGRRRTGRRVHHPQRHGRVRQRPQADGPGLQARRRRR